MEYRHQNGSLYIILAVDVMDQSIGAGDYRLLGVLYMGLAADNKQFHFRRYYDPDQGWCVPKNGHPRFVKV